MQIKLTKDLLQQQARRLQEYIMLTDDKKLSLASAYHALAHIYGYKHWNVLCALLKENEG